MENDFRREHDDLVNDLNACGFQIEALQEWISGRTPGEAVPFLIEALRAAQSDDLREMLARALTEPRFKAAAPALVEAFRRTANEAARWAIGNALATVGFPKPLWPEILNIAADPKYGSSRQMIVWRLHRIQLPETVPLLQMLLLEPPVDAFAVMALGYAGDNSSLRVLEWQSLDGRSPLFKREVPKAIKRLKTRLGA
jgi:hypothetical protein